MSKSEAVSVENMLESIGEMTVVQLCDLVKGIEDKFGVTAAAPVAVAAAPAAGGGDAAAEEEKDSFDVVMTSFGENKINVIKVIRSITGLALKEAKDMVEGVPSTVKEGVSKEDANKVVEQLKEAGATVEAK